MNVTLSFEQQRCLGLMKIQRWVLLDLSLPEAILPISTAVLQSTELSRVNWQQLEESVRNCQKCGLCQSRTQTVFGSGSHTGDLLIVGEAPGAHEDQQGLPFVGRAGKLLTEMLRAIGLAREQVYIANVLKCRPPNNRDPESSEVAACTPYLKKQVDLLEPKVILALGRIAAHFLLNTEQPMHQLRGRAHHFQGTNIPLFVTYHPAYLLRSPARKIKAWEDLLLVAHRLKAT